MEENMEKILQDLLKNNEIPKIPEISDVAPSFQKRESSNALKIACSIDSNIDDIKNYINTCVVDSFKKKFIRLLIDTKTIENTLVPFYMLMIKKSLSNRINQFYIEIPIPDNYPRTIEKIKRENEQSEQKKCRIRHIFCMEMESFPISKINAYEKKKEIVGAIIPQFSEKPDFGHVFFIKKFINVTTQNKWELNETEKSIFNKIVKRVLCMKFAMIKGHFAKQNNNKEALVIIDISNSPYAIKEGENSLSGFLQSLGFKYVDKESKCLKNCLFSTSSKIITKCGYGTKNE